MLDTDVVADGPTAPIDLVDAELTAGLAGLAPPPVRVGWRRIDARDLSSLHDVERARIERAVALRQREFASGRALLRDLIGRRVAIPVAADRRPILPSGIRASLAHDREVVVAAVTEDPAITALGIDVEPASPLGSEIADLVLRPDEAGIDAHLAFTLKEAAYKAWSTLGGRILDHHDVRLTAADGSFTADVIDEACTFTGRWVKAGVRWLALVVAREIPRRSS